MSTPSRLPSFDFHVHTSYSNDCLTPPRLVIEIARRRGLAGIAVTDHDTIEGALATVEANHHPDFTVIPGIEVKTDIGDVIGLYVDQEIRGKRFPDVMEQIHSQGGLVYIPHPLRTFGMERTRLLYEQNPKIDLWEMYNGRYESGDFPKSRELFEALGIRASLCGSDAHFPWEIGLFRTMLPAVPRSPEMLLSMSRQATLKAAPRGDIALSAGISLGAMTKAFKTRKYRKAAGMLASLPHKAFRRLLNTIR